MGLDKSYWTVVRDMQDILNTYASRNLPDDLSKDCAEMSEDLGELAEDLDEALGG